MLRLVGLTKRYGVIAAVDGIDLDVAAGEFFSLLGPSGCGKTTTLRLIGGFEVPDQGSVHLSGVDITETPPHARAVNTVFQSYALFPHLSVFENVAYGLRRRRTSRAGIPARVEEMLELVHLPALGQRMPDELSGGQQQRVALARALINHPDVLLLDEPLGALDLKLRKTMQTELKRIQAEVGITFVYVTHDQDEALTMSDRLAVMRDGRIEQIGPPKDVYDAPSSAFVASFLGAANLFEGRIVASDGRYVSVDLDDGPVVHVAVEHADSQAIGDLVMVGVRPERVRIVERGESSPGDNAIHAVLESLSFTGMGFACESRVGGGKRFTSFLPNTGGVLPRIGADICLAWSRDESFALPREGRRDADPS